jgi:hypothetical protein
VSESSWVHRVRSKAFRVVSSIVPKQCGASAVLVRQVNGAHRETSRESGHVAVVTELRAASEALSVVPAGRQGMPEAGRFDSQGSSSRKDEGGPVLAVTSVLVAMRRTLPTLYAEVGMS